MKIKKKHITKGLNGLINVFFYSCLVGMGLIVFQIFCYTSFKIPTDSMEPTLIDGDRILVNKMILGPRLFNVFASLRGEQVEIYRAPGFGKLKRNDVVVFNFPYESNCWDSIRMNVMQYYVKRCIGLPGDTLEIRQGFYKIRGYEGDLGNKNAQQCLSQLTNPEQFNIVTGTFPGDARLSWNIWEFGPLPIPKKGQIVKMTCENCILYRQLIQWEQKKKLNIKDSLVLLGDSVIEQYRFQGNYYFVSGDNMANSQDSRYWGMLPEEYIVGKAVRVWTSKERHSGKIRWNRVMKSLTR